MELRKIKKRLTAAYNYSFIRMTLNFYTCYEMMAEKTSDPAEETLALYDRYLGSLGSFLEGFLEKKETFEKETLLEELEELRQDTIKEMEKLTALTGVAVPLRRSNVDTDQIIPAVFLKRVQKSGFDDALFYAWRRDPEFVLNQPEYKKGKILVAGPDFGIGSSREHAVWALHDYGFRVVISSRFADIFYGNTAKNGVLAAIMPQESIELLWKLLDEEPGREMTVSLEDRTVTCGDVTLPFEVNDYTRWRLMNGYDDIDLTLQHEDDIIAYEKMRAEKFPFKPKTLPVKREPEQPIESAGEGEYPDWQGPLADRGII